MRKLHLMTIAASMLLALSGPTFAAKRTYHGSTAYSAYARDVSPDRSGAYYYGPIGGGTVYDAVPGMLGVNQPRYTPQQNLPYPDRPYGAPDSW